MRLLIFKKIKLFSVLLFSILLSKHLFAQNEPTPFQNIKVNDELRFDFIDSIAYKNNIVVLSTNTHFDGESLDVIYKLSEYLIKKHGFSKIFMERSFSQIEQVMKEIESGTKPYLAFRNNTGNRTLNSIAFYNFLNNIEPYFNDKSHFRFVGVDVGYDLKYKKFLDSMKNAITKDKIAVENLNIIESNFKSVDYSFLYCDDCPIYKDNYYEFLKYSKIGIRYFDSLYKITKELSDLKNRRKWELLEEAAQIAFNREYPGIDDKKNPMYYATLYARGRDSIIAKNIQWCIDNLFKDEKIIIWISSYHAMKNIGTSKNILKCCVFPGVNTAGNLLANSSLRGKIFSIAFLRGTGTYGFKGVGEVPIGKIKRNSLEWEFSKQKIEYGFMNFRQNYRDKVFYMNPTFGEYLKEKWSEMYDGVIYINEMKPISLLYDIPLSRFQL